MVKIINTAEDDLSALNADENCWVYNGLDNCVTYEVAQVLQPMMDEIANKTYEFSKALQAPVAEMCLRGILVNKRQKQKVLNEFTKTKIRLEEQYNSLVKDGVGVEASWSSPHQVKKLLYDVMSLPVQRKRSAATGQYSPTVDRDALEKLASIYFIAEPIISHILALRDLAKSISFLETAIDPDGRMRTSINIAGTTTGRWSSSESDYRTGTNLQNVTEKLRSVFVADPGWKFANLDLEQGDSRNVGAICWNLFADHQDWNERTAGAYLDACESGDLHTTVARMCLPHLPWGTAPDRQVAETVFYRHFDYRFMCKKLGHGSNYIGTPQTMAKHTKFPVSEVKAFQQSYFDAFPCIPAWHSWVENEIKQNAQLITPFGRRRFFWGRPNDKATIREAVAFVPQSMTAEEINTGILRLWRSNRVQLLMQVHDSILFQFPEELEEEIVPWALELLQVHLNLVKGRDFFVPTEAKTGWNWGNYGEENPDGLAKWKGKDTRKRQETDFRLSLL